MTRCRHVWVMTAEVQIRLLRHHGRNSSSIKETSSIFKGLWGVFSLCNHPSRVHSQPEKPLWPPLTCGLTKPNIYQLLAFCFSEWNQLLHIVTYLSWHMFWLSIFIYYSKILFTTYIELFMFKFNNKKLYSVNHIFRSKFLELKYCVWLLPSIYCQTSSI